MSDRNILDQLENVYASPPDFGTLAFDVPEFAQQRSSPYKTLSGDWTIDWKNDEAVRSLTRALLKRDFDLDITLPSDRLCPTVPSRLEYCLWVLKLALLTIRQTEASPLHRRLIGLDIGTGASCIYPLLLHRLLQRLSLPSNHPNASGTAQSQVQFKLLATEIDDDSWKVATENVSKNACRDRLEVWKVDSSSGANENGLIGKTLLTQGTRQDEVIDFVMCNPPFYTSAEEMETSAQHKDLEPFAVCTAANNELITEGGEVEFIRKMMRESLDIGASKVRWFTSLIGKYSSIDPLVQQLRAYQIQNYHIHLLANAGKTRRWILSWSLQAERIPGVLYSQTLGGRGDHHVTVDSGILRPFLPRSSGTQVLRTTWCPPSSEERRRGRRRRSPNRKVPLLDGDGDVDDEGDSALDPDRRRPSSSRSRSPRRRRALRVDSDRSTSSTTVTSSRRNQNEDDDDDEDDEGHSRRVTLENLVRVVTDATFAGLGPAVDMSIVEEEEEEEHNTDDVDHDHDDDKRQGKSLSSSSSFAVRITLVCQTNSWSRAARRRHHVRGGRGSAADGIGIGARRDNDDNDHDHDLDRYYCGPTKKTADANDVLVMPLHNASRDAVVERLRDEAPLVVAEFRIGTTAAVGGGGGGGGGGVYVVESVEFELQGTWTRGFDSRGSERGWDSLWATVKRKHREAIKSLSIDGVQVG